jgi:hypothetical protein
VRSLSPCPVVKAIFFFFTVIFLISDDSWYSRPASFTICGMASVLSPYCRHSPR